MRTQLPLSYLLFGLSACCIAPALRAQTLGAADVMPQPGPLYHVLPITNEFPWDTLQGQNVSWVYDWVTLDDNNGLTYQAIDPQDAPAFNDYPTANHVMRSISDADDTYIVDYFREHTSSTLLDLGSKGPVLTYVGDMPETLFALPQELGDTLRASYCFGSDGFNIQYHFCGKNYVTFDAMGTLTLPYGTYSDVKHVTHWRSSLETTEPATDSTYAVDQYWFVPGVPFPVLRVSLFIDGGGQIWPSGQLLDEASLTGILETRTRPTWNAYPNPVTDRLTLDGLTPGSLVQVMDPRGQVVQRMPARTGERTLVDMDALAEGLYVVQVIDPQGVRSSRTVVKGGAH